MTAENFCYWLQGLLELQPGLVDLNAEQVKQIREHLKYVFAAPKVPLSPTTPPGRTQPWPWDNFQPSVTC